MPRLGKPRRGIPYEPRTAGTSGAVLVDGQRLDDLPGDPALHVRRAVAEEVEVRAVVAVGAVSQELADEHRQARRDEEASGLAHLGLGEDLDHPLLAHRQELLEGLHRQVVGGGLERLLLDDAAEDGHVARDLVHRNEWVGSAVPGLDAQVLFEGFSAILPGRKRHGSPLAIG